MIDLLSLNRYIILIKSTTETVLSVLGLIRKEDVMFSIDLKDAYVQIPIHPDLCLYRGIALGGCSSPRLCISALLQLQVFTRVFALVLEWPL